MPVLDGCSMRVCALLVAFVGIPGCAGSHRPAGVVVAPSQKVCRLDIAALRTRVRAHPAFQRARQRVRSARKAMQGRIDAMVAAYRAHHALDIRAAKFLKKRDELEKLRGSVISEQEYQRRKQAMAERLRSDPGLAKAVREQENNDLAYRVRKQNAAMEAAKIVIEGRRMRRKLEALADEVEAPFVARVRATVAEAVRYGMTKVGCRVICTPDGQVLAHKADGQVDCGGERARFDLTGWAERRLHRHLESLAGDGGAAQVGSREEGAP